MTEGLSRDRGYIGGGNIAGILGLSPFSSPLQEYLTIIGEGDEHSPEKLAFFRRRKALEPFASECFTIATGMEIVERNHRYDDDEFPFAKAEIDFEVQPDSVRENGETKSVRASMQWMWGDPGSGEEPPFYVTAQAMWGLGVTGREKCWVHALVGLDDDRIYEVHRHEETIEKVRRAADNFWKYYVIPRRQPQPTTIEDINRLYPRDSGRQVEADTEIQLALTERDKAQRILKQQEMVKEAMDLQIKKFMRDATTLTVGGIATATWKSRADGIRVFRVR
jgi:predicted phage-related endonuclease